MFLPFREVALMGGLLAVAVYSAFGFAALVDQTDRATAAARINSPCVAKAELPTCAQDFVHRWDEQLKCSHMQERPSLGGPWERLSGGTSAESPLARNATGSPAAFWQSIH
jgi:hypothetical protein